MCVIVDKPWNHRLSAQVDLSRRSAGEVGDILVLSYCDDALAFDRDCLGDGKAIINGDDLAAGENKIRDRLLRISTTHDHKHDCRISQHSEWFQGTHSLPPLQSTSPAMRRTTSRCPIG